MNTQRFFIFFLLIGILLSVDAGLKYYVHCSIPPMSYYSVFPYGGIGIFEQWYGVSFSINHAMNKGAAWGVFASYQSALLILRIIIVLALVAYLFFARLSLFRFVSFCLIVAGALGNILDTFIYGYVIDMFRFDFGSYTYPIFNLADSSIVCGIMLIFLESIIAAKEKKESAV